MTDDQLAGFKTDIEAAAKESGSLVVQTFVLAPDEESHRVVLKPVELIAVLRHCRPPLVYLHAPSFNARESVEAWWELDDEEDGDEEDSAAVLGDKRVQTFIQKASRQFDGQTGSLLVSFFVGSVHHSCYQQTDWLSTLRETAAELEARLDEEAESGRAEAWGQEDAENNSFATQLAKNPKFSEKRPSREKRIYLAESLFPELNALRIARIVDLAANMDWLKSS